MNKLLKEKDASFICLQLSSGHIIGIQLVLKDSNNSAFYIMPLFN